MKCNFLFVIKYHADSTNMPGRFCNGTLLVISSSWDKDLF